MFKFKNKYLFLIAFVLVIFFIFFSGLANNNVAKSNNQQASISVVDYTNTTVILKTPAKRIIALAPHIVENVYSVGAGKNLVGVMSHSDFPETAKRLPIVGSYNKINTEQILKLKPDLVIAWQSGNKQNSIQQLKNLGIPVYIDQPNTIQDIARSINDIGTLTGNTQSAQNIARQFLSNVAALRSHYLTKEKVSLFYQIWNQPLQTINSDHVINDALEVCGGVNIFANQHAVVPTVNLESILQIDPQVIMTGDHIEENPVSLDSWQKWPQLTAVKNNNLFFVNPDHIHRHTVRLLLAIESICQQLDIARAK